MGPETLDDIPPLPADDGVPPNPALQTRDETFREIASAGRDFGEVDPANLSLAGRRRLEAQRNEAFQEEENNRLNAASPIIAEIARDPNVPVGVKATAIEQVESAVRLGAHPESLAVEELIAQETDKLESAIEQETAVLVAERLADNHDLQQQIFDLQESLRQASDPSIPYLETGLEFITGPILGFIHSDGININNMLESVLPIKDRGPDISAADNIREANRLISEMTPAEKVEVLNKMGDYARNNMGFFLDNGWTVDSLNHVIGVLFGSRMAANIAANQNLSLIHI